MAGDEIRSLREQNLVVTIMLMYKDVGKTKKKASIMSVMPDTWIRE